MKKVSKRQHRTVISILWGSMRSSLRLDTQYRNDFREDVKETRRNMRSSGVFVINIVTEELVKKMHNTSTFYPDEVSEAVEQSLTLAPSISINVPRIALAPASIECRVHEAIFVGNTRFVMKSIYYE